MSRAYRPLAAGLVLHITAHAIPGQMCFPDDRERACFLQLAQSHSQRSQCLIHCYALMDNHVHLLITSLVDSSVAVMMAPLLGRYTAIQNRLLNRAGPLWHSRYSATVIEHESHLVNCFLYIEANPWRAGLVDHPSQSSWTSFGANALGRQEELVVPHPVLLQLSEHGGAWRAAYASLMDEYIKTSVRFKSPTRLPLASDPLAGLQVCVIDPGDNA